MITHYPLNGSAVDGHQPKHPHFRTRIRFVLVTSYSHFDCTLSRLENAPVLGITEGGHRLASVAKLAAPTQ